MTGRSKVVKVTPLPMFDVADDAIRRMQEAVMYQTVRNFPLEREQFLESMIVPGVLALLREVARHTRAITMQTYQAFMVGHTHFTLYEGPIEVIVYYDHMALGMAPPRVDMPPNSSSVWWPDAERLFLDLAEVNKKWDNVRKVKDGLNKLGSMSRAKDIIPNFRNLMPADSLFHAVTPKEPKPQELYEAGLAAGMLREAVSTITEGILANPDQEIPDRHVITVTVAVTGGGRKIPCGLF